MASRAAGSAVAPCLVLAVVMGAVGATAGETGSVQPPPIRDDGRRTLRLLVPNLGRGVVGVFNRDNLGPAVVGTVAAGVASAWDDDLADYVADPEHGFGKSFEDGAAPALVGAVVAGVFVGGRLYHGPRFRAVSYDLLDAFVVNWGYTTALKAVIDRERPNGEDEKSFPSGHASNAFTLATVAERHYGWKAGLPCYALASLVAASRLQRNKHHLSDVVAGAALGYIVGRTVVRVNGGRPEDSRGPSVTLTPLLGPRARGLMVAVVF